MPIYDYKCRQCSNEFELLVLRGTVAACPSCESQDLEQQLSAFAVNSDGIRQQNALKARRSASAHKDVKEQAVAHEEYVKEHRH